MWLALAARNISIANSMGMDLATVCNGCYETFFEAIETLKTDNTLREEVKKVLEQIGKPLPSNTSLKHIVEILGQDIGLDQIKSRSTNQLSKLNIAVHPGCHLFRAHD